MNRHNQSPFLTTTLLSTKSPCPRKKVWEPAPQRLISCKLGSSHAAFPMPLRWGPDLAMSTNTEIRQIRCYTLHPEFADWRQNDQSVLSRAVQILQHTCESRYKGYLACCYCRLSSIPATQSNSIMPCILSYRYSVCCCLAK